MLDVLGVLDVLDRRHIAQRIAVDRDDVAIAPTARRAASRVLPSASAALDVAAWIVSVGVIPHCTIVANRSALLPFG